MDSLNFSIIDIISILALFTSLLFAFQIYFLKKKNSSNAFFAIYLCNIAVIVVFFLVLNLKQLNWAYVILPFLMLSSLSLGPILWGYVRLVTGERISNLKGHFYLPVLYAVVVLIVLLFTQTSFDNTIITYIVKGLTIIVLGGLTIVFLAQNILYITKIYKLYKSHLVSIGNSYSYTESVNLKWFRLLVFGYIGFIIGLVIANLIDDYWSDIMFYLVLLCYVVFAGYNALNQEPVFKIGKVKESGEKGGPSRLTEFFFDDLEQRLLSVMKEKELYLDNSLTIFTLAKYLQTNSKYLSKLINQSFDKNFAFFVNEYRVKYAKKMLSDPTNDKLTIEYIGEQSGFKSKSAFNAAFKKITGITPSIFKMKN